MKLANYIFDAVIVGAGSAGMYASLQLAHSELKVAVLSKIHPAERSY